MSSFDPSAFLDATINEALVKRPPLPSGSEYAAVIEDIVSRTWASKDGTKSGIVLDVKLKLDTSSADIGTPTLTFTDGIMLDLTEAGTIDLAPGKNGKLRRYRDALGMNVPGKPFSPRQMIGHMLRAKIKHEPYEGEIYDKIDAVAKA